MRFVPPLLLLIMLGTPALAGLVITREPDAPAGADVRIAQPNADTSGNTSIRHFVRDPRELKIDTRIQKHYYFRDRDLGQTFRVGGQGYHLAAVTIRTGFGSNAVRPGALGAEMYVQIFRATGTPVIHNHGTTTNPPGAHWETFNPNDPKTDDYLTGETYENVAVVRGGFLPADVINFKSNPAGVPGNGQFLRFTLTGDDAIYLEPNTTYGFLIGFVEPGADRSITFANNFIGNYSGGHGVRREGSPETPAYYNPAAVPRSAYTEALLVDNPGDSADLAAAVDAACFAVDFNERVQNMGFGTMGMPDVCTTRDLTFFINGTVDAPPEAETSGITRDTVPPAGPYERQGSFDDGSTTVRWAESAADRDLGAVFLSGPATRQLSSITVRVATANFGSSVPGLPVLLDFYKAGGNFNGPTYEPLWRATGNFPETLAGGDYVTFHLLGQRQILEANTAYAFLVGPNVEEPAASPDSERFRLQSRTVGTAADTYEIRREGEFGAARPGLADLPSGFSLTRDMQFYVVATDIVAAVSDTAFAPGGFTLGIESLRGGLYRFERSPNLLPPWETIATLPGTGGRLEVTDAPLPAGPRYFYRVHVGP